MKHVRRHGGVLPTSAVAFSGLQILRALQLDAATLLDTGGDDNARFQLNLSRASTISFTPAAL